MNEMTKLYRISEAARKLGRSTDWLRKVENIGKLPRARRDYNGWRVYTSEDIAKLRGLLVGSANQLEVAQQKRDETAAHFK